MRDFLLLILAFFLFAIWIVSWLAFHVAGGLIHLLLVVALVVLVINLLSGRSSV